MRRRTRTEVTVERYERLVLKKTRSAMLPQCPACWEGTMLTPEQAAVFAGVSLRTIFHWVEAGRVHFVETTNEKLAICLASLPMRQG